MSQAVGSRGDLLATGDTAPLKKALTATKPRPATAQWGVFLRNHDELDLGRLTPDQRAAVFAAFGPDPDMQLYERGIRRSLGALFNCSAHAALGVCHSDRLDPQSLGHGRSFERLL